MQTQKKLPRGIRNNNPGNIRISPTRWQGQKAVQSDLSFVEFNTPAAGIRALMKVLMTYYNRHNLKTVRQIINRWAPVNENDTDSYVRSVAGFVGVKEGQAIKVDDPETLVDLTKAIIIHENGPAPSSVNPFWYTDQEYSQAVKSALE